MDADLAALYGLETRTLNQAVKRNKTRFPPDFAFRLTHAEVTLLISQPVTSNGHRGGTRKRPLAFTEHGAVMAATILNSPRAVQMSIFVVRAFLRLREWVTGQAKLARRLAELERRVGDHDHELRDVIETLLQLLEPPAPPTTPIGFRQA